jgi:hypothetical protein
MAREGGRPPYIDVGRPLGIVGEGVPRAVIGEDRADDAGGTEDVPMGLVKHRDQIFALTGIIIGLSGFVPGVDG